MKWEDYKDADPLDIDERCKGCSYLTETTPYWGGDYSQGCSIDNVDQCPRGVAQEMEKEWIDSQADKGPYGIVK